MRRTAKVAERRRAQARVALQPPIVGQVVGVVGERNVEVVADEERHRARCAQHVSVDWLRAALEQVGPVPVGLVPVGGELWVWCVFDGERHESVRADVELRARNVSIVADEAVLVRGMKGTRVECERSRVALTPEKVEVRGGEITSRARRTHRISGGVVRLN